MAIFVAKERSIQQYAFPNGSEERAQHPRVLDTDQTFLIAGHSWSIPLGVIYGSGGYEGGGGGQRVDLPLLLRPWTEYIAVGVQGIVTTAGGTVDFAIWNEAFGAKISLQDISLSDNDLGVDTPAPTDLTGWSAISMYGCGSLGYDAPAGGKGALQVTPSNAWVKCWLRCTLTNAAAHAIYLRTFASPLEIT